MTPSFILSSVAKFGIKRVIIIPINIANTGAPITSSENPPIERPPMKVAIPAITIHNNKPNVFFFKKFMC